MNNRKFLIVTQFISLCLIIIVIFGARYFHLNRYLCGPELIIIAICLLVAVACGICLYRKVGFEDIMRDRHIEVKMTVVTFLISLGLFAGLVYVTNRYLLSPPEPMHHECDDLPKVQIDYNKK